MFSSTAAALTARYLATGIVAASSPSDAAPAPAPSAPSQLLDAGAEADKQQQQPAVGIGGLPLQTNPLPAPIDPRAIKLHAVRDAGVCSASCSLLLLLSHPDAELTCLQFVLVIRYWFVCYAALRRFRSLSRGSRARTPLEAGAHCEHRSPDRRSVCVCRRVVFLVVCTSTDRSIALVRCRPRHRQQCREQQPPAGAAHCALATRRRGRQVVRTVSANRQTGRQTLSYRATRTPLFHTSLLSVTVHHIHGFLLHIM